MYRNTFVKSILAGIVIGVGDMINNLCDVKYLGAFLFSLGLLGILHNGWYLYTGKIGMLWFAEDKKAEGVRLVIGFVGNILGVIMTTALYMLVNQDFKEIFTVNMSKLNEISFGFCFVGGIFCGVLMTIAAFSYKKENPVVECLIVVLCIMVFILAGYKHCIANVPMLIVSGANVGNYVGMVLGNTVGSLIFGGLCKLAMENSK